MKRNVFWSLLAFPLLAGAAEGTRRFVAPPTPPPAARREGEPVEKRLPSFSSGLPREPRLTAAATIYSIGDPLPEEQLYIELINRARANPIAESQILVNATEAPVVGSYDFFNVDLALMQAQFATNPPVPPLAPNALLTAAARRHSGDMLTNSFQEHVGTDGSTPFDRVEAAGYNWQSVGENVFASAESVFHGHAGFEVDWGPGPGGMQPALGHRNAIHDPDYREIGVGVLFGRNTAAPGSQIPGTMPDVGPQLVTQEFGTRQGATPLITGVVYFDLNGNNFYDLGEGVGNVNLAASATATQGVSARSGGYALPVAGNGNYTVTFSGEGFTAVNREVSIQQLENEKVDLILPYVPPVVSGPANPIVNAPNSYQIAPVPAATAYQWRRFELGTPALEGAENGTARVTIDQAGTYNVFEPATKNSGGFSFHLAHPNDGIETQTILLNPSYLVNANSTLLFASRLAASTEDQTAVVEVSTDNGVTWTEIYSQSGHQSGPWETVFQDRTLNLGQFAGSTIRVRFAYVPTGLVFIDTDPGTGWFIDDITFENTAEISNEAVSDATGRTFTFQPAAEGDFVLQGRARTGHGFLPWGPGLAVRAEEGTTTPLELRVGVVRLANGQVEFDANVVSGAAPAGLTVESKTSLSAAWTTAAANIETISPTQFRISTTARGPMGFYRIKAD